jgi:hypothetical protein
MNWRDHLPIHPAAELFPRMSELELDALAQDIIKQKGLRHPVALWAPGKPGDGENMSVLDGINRLDALERNGIKFITDDGRPDLNRHYFTCLYERRITVVKTKAGVRKGDEPDVDPWDYVVSANIHRRHLSRKQKHELIAKLLKAKPEQSNRRIAKQVKADDKTVGKVRAKLEGRAEIPHVETTTDTKGRQQRAHKGKGKDNGKTESAGAPIYHSCDSPNRRVVVTEDKPRSGVRSKDDTLLWFTATICELSRKTGKQKPERFAATTVGTDDLAKLGVFLNDIAKLKAAGVRSAEISEEEMSAKFAALDVAQAK